MRLPKLPAETRFKSYTGFSAISAAVLRVLCVLSFSVLRIAKDKILKRRERSAFPPRARRKTADNTPYLTWFNVTWV